MAFVLEGIDVLLLLADELVSDLKRSKNFWISGSTGSLGAAACAACTEEDWFCTGVDGFCGDGDAQSQPMVTVFWLFCAVDKAVPMCARNARDCRGDGVSMVRWKSRSRWFGGCR